MALKKDQSRMVDAYIDRFPPDVQRKLESIRIMIKETAPDAVEVFSYGMPGFHLNGSLVWYAAFAHHIGFYPTGSGIEAFKDEISHYQWSKGTVRFPLDQPIPPDLIRRIVLFRVAENSAKTKKTDG